MPFLGGCGSTKLRTAVTENAVRGEVDSAGVLSSEQHTQQKEAKKHEGAMQIEMQDSLCFLTTL